MSGSQSAKPYTAVLSFLMIVMLFLGARLVYLYLGDSARFPISTVKVVSMQKYITNKELDTILEKYWQYSFFSIPIARLEAELSALSFMQEVKIDRIWPDILKINLHEKEAVAFWNDQLITMEGVVFDSGKTIMDNNLPHLIGPQNKHQEVLQIYKKMSKILSVYGLSAASLVWRENQAWELALSNGIHLRLGKKDLEARINRFCKAYPAVFGAHPEQLVSVDLRYPRGMAVAWKK